MLASMRWLVKQRRIPFLGQRIEAQLARAKKAGIATSAAGMICKRLDAGDTMEGHGVSRWGRLLNHQLAQPPTMR